LQIIKKKDKIFCVEKILISACLVGDKCRYDGKGSYCPEIEALLERYELVPFCPEVEGGLKVPRIPSEIKNNQVINAQNIDNTAKFELGAEKAMSICSYLGIKKAILKDNSPSCGVHQIYDGGFHNRLIDGQGITARYLKKRGIKVYSENEISMLIEVKNEQK
jgi:uncharacterized protein YbbK (DUF523 family)